MKNQNHRPLVEPNLPRSCVAVVNPILGREFRTTDFQRPKHGNSHSVSSSHVYGTIPLLLPWRIPTVAFGHVVAAVYEDGDTPWLGLFDFDDAGAFKAREIGREMAQHPPDQIVIDTLLDSRGPFEKSKSTRPENRLNHFVIIRYEADKAEVIDEFLPQPSTDAGRRVVEHREAVSYTILAVVYITDTDRDVEFATAFFPDTNKGLAAAKAHLDRVGENPLLPFQQGIVQDPWSFPLLLPMELAIFRFQTQFTRDEILSVVCPDSWRGQFVPFLRGYAVVGTTSGDRRLYGLFSETRAGRVEAENRARELAEARVCIKRACGTFENLFDKSSRDFILSPSKHRGGIQ